MNLKISEDHPPTIGGWFLSFLLGRNIDFYNVFARCLGLTALRKNVNNLANSIPNISCMWSCTISRFPMNSHDISLVFFHDTRSKKTLLEIVLMVFAQSQAMFRAMFVGPRPAVATKARESVSWVTIEFSIWTEKNPKIDLSLYESKLNANGVLWATLVTPKASTESDFAASNVQGLAAQGETSGLKFPSTHGVPARQRRAPHFTQTLQVTEAMFGAILGGSWG